MKNQNDKHFNRIKEVLKEKGVKANWLAEKMGKSYPTMIAYTSNSRQPSIEVLYQIAELLQVSVKDLLIDNKELEK
nr:helix-turn-helix transcriptional regulator [uncultured Brumimicrobium sp.]